jgi:hypothetical protein
VERFSDLGSEILLRPIFDCLADAPPNPFQEGLRPARLFIHDPSRHFNAFVADEDFRSRDQLRNL